MERVVRRHIVAHLKQDLFISYPHYDPEQQKGKAVQCFNACLSAYPASRQTCYSDPTTLQRARPQRPEDLCCNRVSELGSQVFLPDRM